MIYRVKHDRDNPYFMLNRYSVEDDRLSFKAVGILTYLLSKPDNWIVREEDLARRHTDGSTAVRSGLKELKDLGYIVVSQIREGGKISGWETHVYEKPQQSNPLNEGETHNVGFPQCSPPTLLKTQAIVSSDLVVSIDPSKKELSGGPDVSLFQGEGFNINGEDTPAKETYATSFAKRLYACLAEHRKIFAKVNLEKWTETIRIFLVNSELSREDLDPVLDWYSKNINGEFSPQAYSADAFVKKFVQIKRQMDIANQSISSAKNGAMSVYEKNQQSVDIVLERLRAKNGSK